MNNRRYRARATPLGTALTVIGLVLCVVFGLMLVCNVTIIVKGALHPEMPPSVLGVTPMAVLSGSMSGTQDGHIEVGDLIFVTKAEPDKLGVGDVIAFMDGKIVVTHRIVEVQTADDGTTQWITKGDANNAADQTPVTPDRLVGVYAGRLPKVGDLAMFVQQPLGMAIFIGLPLLAFIGYDILRRQLASNREYDRVHAMQAEIERLRAINGDKKN